VLLLLLGLQERDPRLLPSLLLLVLPWAGQV
jgi:hypothetical protein